MTDVVTDDLNDQSCEATGHPSECTEPAPGSVQGTSHNVTVNDANGNEKPIATRASTLHFDSHAHDHTSTEGCHDNQSHDLTGADLDDTNLSSSININGEPVLIVADGVATDPGTGSPVNIVASGINNSLTETP